MTPDARLQILRNLAATMPDLGAQRIWENSRLLPEEYAWLGRLAAVVGDEGEVGDGAAIKSSTQLLLGYSNTTAVNNIMAVLYRAIGRAEAAATGGALGGFIPAGGAFDAMAAVGKVFGNAKSSILIVDPYMDASALFEFGPLVPEKVRLAILSDQQTVKPDFRAAVSRWQQQYGQNRPLEAKLAAPRSLHDRLFIVDGGQVWVLTQSLKDLAARSHASLLQVTDEDMRRLKVAAYSDLWSASSPV